MSELFAEELAAISRIDAVQTILEVICRSTGMGFSAVARVTETKWVACAVRDEIAFGLKPGGELELGTTICDEIRQTGKLVVIDHVATDAMYREHHTPRQYGFQSYLSVPIYLKDGRFFGTLCAIDPRPAKVNTPETLGMFKLFADLIAMHLEAQERMSANEAALVYEREQSKLREEFIAVLGHDLRNPLSAIHSGMDLLKMGRQDEETMEVVEIVQRSTARMGELIQNVVDFARGRLGGGMTMRLVEDKALGKELEQVVTELQTAWPGREIQWGIAVNGVVLCDGARLAQMLSNLVANALTHGEKGSPVWVRAETTGGRFELSVRNRGAISAEAQGQLFQPFSRGKARAGQQGLGLGLYIASEIARAHGGELTAKVVEGETWFVFRMGVGKG
jgi:signal transduction histidine kinase